MVQNEQEMQQIIYQIQSCEEEIGKAIIGQKAIIRQMLIAILTDGNVQLHTRWYNADGKGCFQSHESGIFKNPVYTGSDAGRCDRYEPDQTGRESE